ncbi:MAG: chalcone isomerase family protein [Pseudomonadota bacterium]
MLSALLGLWISLLPTEADAADFKPPEILKAFGQTLMLNGCASRDILWIDLYDLALYLPSSNDKVDATAPDRQAKTFWIKVTYDGSIPKGIPSEQWKEILKSDLSQKVLDRLGVVIGKLKQGDIVQVQAAPGQGDRLYLNGQLEFDESHADLSKALTTLWLGPNPVSKNMRRLLLLGHC